MFNRNHHRVSIFLLFLLGTLLATASGLVTNILTSDPKRIFSSENAWLWFLLFGLIILTAIVAFTTESSNSEEAASSGDANSMSNTEIENSQLQQGNAQGNLLQNQFIQIIQSQTSEKGSIFHILSYLFLFLGMVVLLVFPLQMFWLGILLIAASGCLYLMGNALKESSTESYDTNSSQVNSSVHINGDNNINGNNNNYNSHNSIFIDSINLNQEVPKIIDEIQNTLKDFQFTDFNEEELKNQILQDLLGELRVNLDFREHLKTWERHLNKHFESEEAIVDELLRQATPPAVSKGIHSTKQQNHPYKKLEFLLRNRKWEKADEETARIIAEICGINDDSDIYQYWPDIPKAIKLFLKKDALNLINDLWVKYSGGRFGFSVQQKIWEGIQAKYHSGTYFSYDVKIAALKDFGHRVGWLHKGDWILFSDIDYSQNAPSGHLPALIMGDLYQFKFHQQFAPDCELFEVFMRKQY